MNVQPSLENFEAYQYDPETYWHNLQVAVGYTPKTDPSSLTIEQLCKLGKALQREHKRLTRFDQATDPYSGPGFDDPGPHSILEKIKEVQDAESFEADYVTVRKAHKTICRIGNQLRHGEHIDHKTQGPALRSEQYYCLDEIKTVSQRHGHDAFKTGQDELKDLWREYYHEIVSVTHNWAGHPFKLRTWLSDLGNEYKKRQPGYVEPTMEDLVAKDAKIAAFDVDDWADEEDDFDYDNLDPNLEALEDALRYKE